MSEESSTTNAVLNTLTPELLPALAECFLIRVGTGCSCCSYENFIEGPWRTREAAEQRAQYHLKVGTLSSQYAAKGTASVFTMPYQLAGEWIILDEMYAVKGAFLDEQEDSWPQTLTQFERSHHL